MCTLELLHCLVQYFFSFHVIRIRHLYCLVQYFFLFQIIRNRLRPTNSFVWNRQPGGLTFDPSFSHSLSDYPFYRHGNRNYTYNYTVVVSCTKPALKGTSPLIRLIKGLSKSPRMSKVRLWLLISLISLYL